MSPAQPASKIKSTSARILTLSILLDGVVVPRSLRVTAWPRFTAADRLRNKLTKDEGSTHVHQQNHHQEHPALSISPSLLRLTYNLAARSRPLLPSLPGALSANAHSAACHLIRICLKRPRVALTLTQSSRQLSQQPTATTAPISAIVIKLVYVHGIEPHHVSTCRCPAPPSAYPLHR